MQNHQWHEPRGFNSYYESSDDSEDGIQFAIRLQFASEHEVFLNSLYDRSHEDECHISLISCFRSDDSEMRVIKRRMKRMCRGVERFSFEIATCTKPLGRALLVLKTPSEAISSLVGQLEMRIPDAEPGWRSALYKDGFVPHITLRRVRRDESSEEIAHAINMKIRDYLSFIGHGSGAGLPAVATGIIVNRRDPDDGDWYTIAEYNFREQASLVDLRVSNAILSQSTVSRRLETFTDVASRSIDISSIVSGVPYAPDTRAQTHVERRLVAESDVNSAPEASSFGRTESHIMPSSSIELGVHPTEITEAEAGSSLLTPFGLKPTPVVSSVENIPRFRAVDRIELSSAYAHYPVRASPRVTLDAFPQNQRPREN